MERREFLKGLAAITIAPTLEKPITPAKSLIDYYTLNPWRFRGEQRPTRFDITPKSLRMNFDHYKIASKKDNTALDSWYIDGTRNPKKAIILCHANSESKSDLLEYANFLHNNGYNLFMFDFRGQGKSGGLYVTYGCHEQEDLRAAIEHLKKERGIEKIAVYGQRMGAATALIEQSNNQNN
jgi:pimeloyl-ACP methyl ester carboxylesterase